MNDALELHPQSSIKVALRKGRAAAWQNRWPGLCLWIFGMAIIVGYFYVPSIRSTLEALGELKTRFGLGFSVVSTSLFGGLLPMVLPPLLGRPLPKSFWFLLISNSLFWAYKGLEIDLLYQIQAWLFGNDSDGMTVAAKVAVDQILYAPLVGLLNCVLFYIWRDHHFSVAKTKVALGERWYVRRVLPILISNWCVWLPSVILIYNLPLALQLPVQNLILCFWVLVLVFFTNDDFGEVADSAGQ